MGEMARHGDSRRLIFPVVIVLDLLVLVMMITLAAYSIASFANLVIGHLGPTVNSVVCRLD